MEALTALLLATGMLAAFVAGWGSHFLYVELRPAIVLWWEMRKPGYGEPAATRPLDIGKDIGKEYGKLPLRQRFVMQRHKGLN